MLFTAEGVPLSPTSIAMTAAMKIFYDEPEHSTSSHSLSSTASDIKIHETPPPPPPDSGVQETRPPGGGTVPETGTSSDSPENQPEKDREKEDKSKSTSGNGIK